MLLPVYKLQLQCDFALTHLCEAQFGTWVSWFWVPWKGCRGWAGNISGEH